MSEQFEVHYIFFSFFVHRKCISRFKTQDLIEEGRKEGSLGTEPSNSSTSSRIGERTSGRKKPVHPEKDLFLGVVFFQYCGTKIMQTLQAKQVAYLVLGDRTEYVSVLKWINYEAVCSTRYLISFEVRVDSGQV